LCVFLPGCRPLGRDADAITLFERALELNPQRAPTRASLAGSYRKPDRKSDYDREVALAIEMSTNESKYNRACLESIRGNVDEALPLLKAALEKKQQSRTWDRTDPDFDFIRDDSRFQALLSEG